MKETYRYLLPALLHTPIHHFQQYLLYLEVRSFEYQSRDIPPFFTAEISVISRS